MLLSRCPQSCRSKVIHNTVTSCRASSSNMQHTHPTEQRQLGMKFRRLNTRENVLPYRGRNVTKHHRDRGNDNRYYRTNSMPTSLHGDWFPWWPVSMETSLQGERPVSKVSDQSPWRWSPWRPVSMVTNLCGDWSPWRLLSTATGLHGH